MSQSSDPIAQQLARALQAQQILKRQQAEAERRAAEGDPGPEPPPDIELPGDDGPEARARAAAELAAKRADPVRAALREALASKLDTLVDMMIGRPELLEALLGVSTVGAAPAASAASSQAGAADGGQAPARGRAKKSDGGGGEPPAPPAGGTGGGGDGKRPPKERKLRAPTKGQEMVMMLEERTFFRSMTGRLYIEHQGEAVACDGAQYQELVTGAFWARYRDTVGTPTIREGTNVLGSRTKERRPVPIRVAGDARRLVLDLGAGLAPWVVTPETIDVMGEEDTPPCFHRPPGTLPLPRPQIATSDEEAAATMGELRTVLGVEDGTTWASLVAWMTACLRPVGPYPVLLLRGEKGSGKSTLARALRKLVDPRQPDLKTLPKGKEEIRTLAISAEHGHVQAFDNLSGLDGDLSDALCRLSTGDALEVRALYTGRDLDTFVACRPIILTSITDVATRPDLLDRALMVRLPPRSERIDDDEFNAAVDALAPRVLGALLWAIHRGMQRLEVPEGEEWFVDVPGAIRLRAPARWAAAAEVFLGLPEGATVEAYLASKEEAEELDAEDPFAAALLEWLEPGPNGEADWSGTAKEMLVGLTKHAYDDKKAPAYWPESPRALRGRLDRSMGTLRAHGVTVSYRVEGHDKKRMVYVKRLPQAKGDET